MKLLQSYQFLLFCMVLVSFLKGSSGLGSNTSRQQSNDEESSSNEELQTSASAPTRVAKDFLKNFNRTMGSNSTLYGGNLKRSPPPLLSGSKVQIIESGSRSRGEARILKRGPSPSERRFSNSHVFTRQKQGNSGADGQSSLTSSTSVDTLGSFQVIAIPGSNVPPPIYSYTGVVAPPSPPPSIITGGPGSQGGQGGSYGGNGYKPGGAGGGSHIFTTTPRPLVVTPGPGPKPIGPPLPGTSVPIIGGGGRPILPPSPPPEEVFPPAPPPDEDDFADDIGRRLKVDLPSRDSGGRSGGVGIRTRTRVLPSTSPRASNSRFSKDSISLITSHERLGSGSGGVGGTMRRDRLRDRVKEFKTSLLDDVEAPLSDEINADDPNIIRDFVFSDIKCFKTRQNEYFGATIHMKSGFHLPYIRDRPQDPLSSEECRLEQVEGTRGSYHMAVTDLRGCGVEQCGEAMCLTMVFPRVPILALADDEVTTIKCIPQKSTISDTKTISFAGDSTENRRSSSTVEGGIQEFVAEVGVFRQNPGATNGLFVKRVNSGGIVQLGEPLQLRSVVRGTDGWKHSKLTDVKVWRMRDNFKQNLENLDPGQASEVITLVDPHGCRNDEYVAIAEEHPIRDPRNDMVHHFTFKAFLFRGQRVNEPLIVTARVHACQELQDCLMECDNSGKRYKRSPIELHNASAIVHDFDSQLALRVVGLKDHPSSILDDDQFPFNYPPSSAKSFNKTSLESGTMSCGEKMFASGLGGSCIMLLICGLTFALYTYVKQGKLQYGRKSATSPHRTNRGYRYPPPSGRMMPSSNSGGPGQLPYQKPLPPTPIAPSQTDSTHSVQQGATSTNPSPDGKPMSDISQVAKLLQELAKNTNNEIDKKCLNAGKSALSGKLDSSSAKKNETATASSDYACIDETSSGSAASSSSSEIDLSKANKSNKDGVYILYCYNKDKKNKLMLPLSAPSSTRMRRKILKGCKGSSNNKRNDNDDNDEFISEDEDSSEVMASQTEDVTESDDSYEEMQGKGKNSVNTENVNSGGNLGKNQVIRRTVREVKKKSKQNNNISYSGGGIIRRRVSSVYREGYLNGLRGAVSAAVSSSRGGSGGSFPLRYRKSPSTGNIPEAVGEGGSVGRETGHRNPSGKRINFSVRERRSARKRRQQYHHPHRHQYDQYSASDGIHSEATMGSDLDSAYSGSNCSKLTEDHLYELKRAGGGSGHCPDFYRSSYKVQQNLADVQRQLRRNGGAQGHYPHKQEVRRTSSSPNDMISNNNNKTAVAVGLDSPPLSLGETKATHFVTHDDSSTKILIVPETHV